MKLCVYVPARFAGDSVPQEAENLSKETMLPIRLGEQGDGIDSSEVSIIRIPEMDMCEYDRKPRKGFIHPIDYTNEFVVFTKDTVLELSGAVVSTVRPVLCERHVARFRIRHDKEGKYTFKIVDRGEVLTQGEFEVES